MADYNFPDIILRTIQNQDELNMRNKQMNLEEARFQQQAAQANRQYALALTKAEAERSHWNVLERQGQERIGMALQNQKQTWANNFLSHNEPANDVPKEFLDKMPTAPDMFISPELGAEYNIAPGAYYNKARVSNIISATNLGLNERRTKAAELNANTNRMRENREQQKMLNTDNTDVKLDSPTKTLMSNIEANYQDAITNYDAQGKPKTTNLSNLTTSSTDVWNNIIKDTNKMVGRYQGLDNVIKDVWNDIKNNKSSVQNALKNAEYKYGNKLTPQKKAVLNFYFKYRTSSDNTKDDFEIGKIYEDSQGNKAKYLGNGQWENVK